MITVDLFILLQISVVYCQTRYFLGDFDGLTTPFPFNQCVIKSDGAYMYECNNNGTIVTENYYDGEFDCTGTISLSKYYNSTQAQFNCFGVDSYVQLSLAVDLTGQCSIGIGLSAITTNICYEEDSLYYQLRNILHIYLIQTTFLFFINNA